MVQLYLGLYWSDLGKRRRSKRISRCSFRLNHRSYRSANKRGPNIYPKDVPAIVSDKSNRKSLDNSYDALNKVCSDLTGGKKRGVKPGSNIKSDKTQEDWYLPCKSYRKLAIRDIKMMMISFLNSSHCSDCFTGIKI